MFDSFLQGHQFAPDTSFATPEHQLQFGAGTSTLAPEHEYQLDAGTCTPAPKHQYQLGASTYTVAELDRVLPVAPPNPSGGPAEASQAMVTKFNHFVETQPMSFGFLYKALRG